MSNRVLVRWLIWIASGVLLALLGGSLLWRFLYLPAARSIAHRPRVTQAEEIPAQSPALETPIPHTPAPAAATNATSIDLAPFYNAGLTNAVMMGVRNHPNNLGEFPEGEIEAAGVRFSVGGAIHVGNIYPPRVEGIKVGARCQRLHLLHGTGGAPPEGTPVALLTLHYADGSAEELPIIYGQHVRDWWAWKKNEPAELDAGSAIAWEGSNEYARSKNCKIRVYRSTLANPKPDLVIETADYVRAARGCNPFLLGLSVD
jgi:hypothetical protein